MSVAALDLELDVFAGPFDLLLAVVLREEVDLLEVELGEVVVAYVEHLEREGELELEVATEFLALIASPACSSTAATAPRPSSWSSASRASAVTSTARRHCRRSCGGSRSTRRPPSTTPSSSAPRWATCSPLRPRSTPATSGRPSRLSGGWTRSARPS